MDATEIPLRSDADAVVLVGQLSTRNCIKIEAFHTTTNAGIVLKATGIRFAEAAAMNLCYTYPPNAGKGSAGYHRYHHRVT